MAYTITPCRQEVDGELLVQFSKLSFKKKQSLEGHQKATLLRDKCLPLLTQCRQNRQFSLRRVTDMMQVALEARDGPVYIKKGTLKRTLIVDKNEFYILLKSKGKKVISSDKARLSVAIRVPFNENENASLVYQLVNTDTSRRISAAELKKRAYLSSSACGKLKELCPKITAAYSYVKKNKATKVSVFIESKGFLCAYDPSKDRQKNFGYREDYCLLDYVEKGDADSVFFILSHFNEETTYYNFPVLFKRAAQCKHYDIAEQLLKKKVLEDALLLEALPQTLATEEEKKFTALIINSCANRERALEEAYYFAANQNCEQVQFVYSLGSFDQEMHTEALVRANTLQVVALIASQIEDIAVYGGKALESAAFSHSWDIVFYLIEKGVSVNFHDGDGLTALAHAVYAPQCEDSIQAVKKLLELGADPTILDDEKFQPVIYWAARKRNDRVVDLLLERSTDRQKDEQIVALAMEEPRSDSDDGSNSDNLN